MKRAGKAVAALLVISLILLSLFIVLTAHHDHAGDHCTVCVRIEAAVRIIRSAVCAALILLAATVFLASGKRLFSPRADIAASETPVILGVKLNN